MRNPHCGRCVAQVVGVHLKSLLRQMKRMPRSVFRRGVVDFEIGEYFGLDGCKLLDFYAWRPLLRTVDVGGCDFLCAETGVHPEQPLAPDWTIVCKDDHPPLDTGLKILAKLAG